MTVRMRAAVPALFLVAGALGCGTTDIGSDEAMASTSVAQEAPAGATLSTRYARPGFVAYELDGRLWIFRDGSEGLEEFQATGEPGKCYTMIGGGPGGMTIKSSDKETVDAYLKG